MALRRSGRRSGQSDRPRPPSLRPDDLSAVKLGIRDSYCLSSWWAHEAALRLVAAVAECVAFIEHLDGKTGSFDAPLRRAPENARTFPHCAGGARGPPGRCWPDGCTGRSAERRGEEVRGLAVRIDRRGLWAALPPAAWRRGGRAPAVPAQASVLGRRSGAPRAFPLLGRPRRTSRTRAQPARRRWGVAVFVRSSLPHPLRFGVLNVLAVRF